METFVLIGGGLAGAKAAVAGMKHLAQLEPYRLQDLHARLRQGSTEPMPSGLPPTAAPLRASGNRRCRWPSRSRTFR